MVKLHNRKGEKKSSPETADDSLVHKFLFKSSPFAYLVIKSTLAFGILFPRGYES